MKRLLLLLSFFSCSLLLSQNSDTAIPSESNWKKNSENTRFWLYNNGEEIASKSSNFYIKNDLVVFWFKQKKVFLLKDFLTAAPNELHPAEELNINSTFGVWYKHDNGAVSVYNSNGKLVKKTQIYRYASNNIDVEFKGEHEPSMFFLKNYKNADTYKLYGVKNQYVEQATNMVENLGTLLKKQPNITVLKGNYPNDGYCEIKTSDGIIYQGFIKDFKVYGPGVVSKGNSIFNLSRFGLREGETYYFQYYKKDGLIHMKNSNTKMGLYEDTGKNEIYKINFSTNGNKVISKQLLQPTGNTSGCIMGNCTNGIGVYNYEDGSQYKGVFKNGEIHDFGILNYKNGDVYIGQYYNGKMSGIGEYIWGENYYYLGEYYNGKRDGVGVMHYNKTSFEAGIWKNGNLVENFNNQI